MNKQDIEQCVRNVIEQKHIPEEDKIRQIVREEIKGFYEKKEDEEKIPFLEKFKKFIDEKRYLNIGWYILMFIFLFIDVLCFNFLTSGTKSLLNGTSNIHFGVCVILFGIFLFEAIIIFLTMKLYDKMLEINYKSAKVIFLMELVYLCNIAFPELTSWIEYIL